MALAIGSRLAHYDVTALIGEGAWGRSIRPPIPSSTVRRTVALRPFVSVTTHRTYGVRSHVCREPTTVNTSIELLDTTTLVLAERPEPTGKMAPCERSGSGWPGPFSSCH